MRVERTPSVQVPLSAAPIKPAAEKKETPSNLPQESWDGPTVDEREARKAELKEDSILELPGIAEGLTEKYLQSRTSSAPITLLATCLQPASFSLREFPGQATGPDRLSDYAHNLATHTKALYQGYFTDHFLDLDLVVQVQVGKGNNGGYEWVRGQSRLTLQLEEQPTREPHMSKTTGALESGHLFRRGVSDLISFVHEYAHATYDALMGVPASVDVNVANRSFSEGFAVLLELLAIDHLLELEPHQMYVGDPEDLKERRVQRVRWLQLVLEEPRSPAHLAYAEGAELMAGLHRAGGLLRVIDFVKSIVPNKANALSRQNPNYRQAVGDPVKMGGLVSA